VPQPCYLGLNADEADRKLSNKVAEVVFS